MHTAVKTARGSVSKGGGVRDVIRGVAQYPAREYLPRRGRSPAAVDYPEGADVLAEYWLETESPRVVAVIEAQSMDAFGQIRMDWGDTFEMEVFPAVTAEQGLEMARQAMSGRDPVEPPPSGWGPTGSRPFIPPFSPKLVGGMFSETEPSDFLQGRTSGASVASSNLEWSW
jgi:hypothetical protein